MHNIGISPVVVEWNNEWTHNRWGSIIREFLWSWTLKPGLVNVIHMEILERLADWFDCSRLFIDYADFLLTKFKSHHFDNQIFSMEKEQ